MLSMIKITVMNTVGGWRELALFFLIWYSERNRQFLIFTTEIK